MKISKSAGSAFADIGYSPAIDGLRAVAVLSVILYHAFSTALPAGLVGVDIFFVISGFVVSGSVLSRGFKGPGDLWSFFFSRRLKRIAPALIACILFTTAAAIAFIPKVDVSDTNLSTGLAALFGVSNIVLFRASGDYFAPRAELNPFTHTWSLGVEEQFYVLFPLLAAALLLVGQRRQRAATLGVWIAISAASALAAAHYSTSDPSAAFYLSPARFWELGLGVIAYLLIPIMLPRLRSLPAWTLSAIAGAAIAGIIASLVFARSWSATFPFWAVVPAVISVAVLLVLLIAAPQSPVASTLARSPVVYVGRISYSLYLWHWPVFVLMRWTVGFATPLQIAAGVALTALLATASYHLVELPVRSGDLFRRRRSVTISAGLACVALSAGGVALASANQQRLTASVTKDFYNWHPESITAGIAQNCGVAIKTAELRGGGMMEFSPVSCKAPGADRTIFVAGDSHVGSLIRVFNNAVVSDGYRVRIFSRPGCGALSLRKPHHMVGQACEDYVNSTFAEIERDARPGDILLLSSLRTERLQAVDGGTLVPDSTVTNLTRAEALAEAQALLRPLTARGVRVVFDAPMPVFNITPFRCSDWFNKMNPTCAAGFEIPRAELDAMRLKVLESMTQLTAAMPGVSIWDPALLLCDEKVCSARRDGKSMFFDGDHLSGWGNDVLWPSFREHMTELQATKNP